MITGDELRDAREISADMTQKELSDLLGVSIRTVVNWEASGVPPKRQSRVMQNFGPHIDSIRRGKQLWKEQEEWLESAQGQAYYAEQGQMVEDRAQQESDPIGFGLENASNERLIEELRRRLGSQQGVVSQVDYTLAASDADIDAESEAQQEQP